MPGVWPLNNLATQAGYVDALTAQFPTGRKAFSLQVYGNAVYYRLISFTPPNNYQTEPTEHFLGPVLAQFDDPEAEGLPHGMQFGGIMLRSADSTKPATVTVI